MARDLRLPGLALVAWGGTGIGSGRILLGSSMVLAGAAAGLLGSGPIVPAAGGTGRGGRTFLLLVVLLALAGWSGPVLRHQQERASPVTELAAQRALVRAVVRITSDPRAVAPDRFRVGVQVVGWRGERPAADRSWWRGRAAAVVWGDPTWRSVRLGERWEVTARLQPGEPVGLAPRGPPTRLQTAGWTWRAAAVARAGVRTAARAGESPPPRPDTFDVARALLPAMVDGDDAAVPDAVHEQFRRSGLTHLLAVSGTNLTVVLAFLLVVARSAGVRGRWLVVVGLVGVGCFVLLARGEPSVVRAATMGAVGVLALGQRDPRRGLGVLAASVLVLVLVVPALAGEPGFALSVCATAGILLWAPGWQQALSERGMAWTGRSGRVWTWFEVWLPAAVAVPLAAQVACTPIVVVLSGQASLVAVLANLVVAPVVGPVTLSGFVGGLLAIPWAWAGQVAATPGVWGCAWLVVVARWAAQLPGAAVDVTPSVTGLTTVVLVCGLVLLLVRWATGGPLRLLVLMVLLLVVVAAPRPRLGWPPEGWLVAACDVGQGDALLLNAGNGSAVMVDTGPEPGAARDCLRRFGIDRVPLLLITHFHADHIGGVAGVADMVEAVETTALTGPGERETRAVLGRTNMVVATSKEHRIGAVDLRVLASDPRARNPNDASVVSVARVRGPGRSVTVLLTGDLGRHAQRWFEPRLAGLDVDVLKVAHHGSRDTDLAWMQAVTPEVALVSVGEDNTYGHPAPEVLSALTGVQVGRTDRDGDLAVVADASGVRVLRR